MSRICAAYRNKIPKISLPPTQKARQICGLLFIFQSQLRRGEGAAQVFRHADVFFRIAAGGGEVASHHDAVQAAGEGVGLKAPEIDFPAAGGADERLRKDEAEHGKGAEHFQRRQAAVRVERRAFYRIQDIERNGVDVHFLQGECHLHALVEGFPEADDAAGAHADARFLRGGNDDVLILEGMGGADLREIGRRSLDIAVDAGDARFLQLPGLLVGDEAEGAAHLDAYFLPDAAHQVEDLLKFIGVVLIASTGDERKPHRAGLFGFPRGGEHFLLRQETIDLRARLVPAGLGAEFAVFLAVAAPRIDDGAEINCIAAEFLADLVSHRQQQHGVLVLRADEPLCFLLCNGAAVHDFFGQLNDFSTGAFHIRVPP